MKFNGLLLAVSLVAGTVFPARANYTVTFPPGITPFSYQNSTAPPALTSDSLAVVFAGANTLGQLDGTLVYVPNYNSAGGPPTGFTIVTMDSTFPTGWADVTDVRGVAPPIMKTGDGAYFLNNLGTPLTITFTGTSLASDLGLSVPLTPTPYWYLRGRQVSQTATTWNQLMQENPPVSPISVYFGAGPLASPQPWVNTAGFYVSTWDGVSQWVPPFPALQPGQAVWIGPPPSAIIEGVISQGSVCGTSTPLPNWTMQAVGTAGTFYGLSSANGLYAIRVPPGIYSVSPYSPPAGWVHICGNPPPITATVGNVYPGNNIQEYNTVAGQDLSVDLISLFPYPLRSACCGQNMTYLITY